MTENRLEYLFGRYMNGTVSVEENEEFMELVGKPENKDALQMLLQKLITETQAEHSPSINSEEAILEAIFQARPPVKIVPIKSRTWWRYIAAAVVILVASASAFLIFNKKEGPQPVAREQIQTDIAPGHDGAYLTLADGTVIVLDSAQDGNITDVAIKTGNKISYKANEQTAVEYNTMTTPRGRQFSLVLPDGTQVWLNTASSITYPTAFTGNERRVSITGEAYFEVSHNAKKPFHVSISPLPGGQGGMDVQVLGTHFNINSYSDEDAIKTTLLEGSVKVTASIPAPGGQGGGRVVTLSPGQQSVLEKNGALALNKEVNTDEIMAWKNGNFHFESADLKTILRQFSRWYDVEVVYEGQVPNDKYFVIVKRNSTLSSVLKALQAINIRFKIEGKKLIVQSS